MLRLGPPAGARNRKKKKMKYRGGGEGVICAPSAKHGIVPNYVVKPYSMSKKLKFQDK